MNIKHLLFFVFLFICSIESASAQDGYDLWLNYDKVENQEYVDHIKGSILNVYSKNNSEVLTAAKDELKMAFSKMFDHNLKDAMSNGNNAINLILKEDFPSTLRPRNLEDHDDAYAIDYSTTTNSITIVGNTEVGILYGCFDLIKSLQLGKQLSAAETASAPKVDVRILNHWDNLDRTVERGYAGVSLWNWHRLPAIIEQKYIDYARANASVGINGTVLTNVNANSFVLTDGFLEKVKGLADAFRPYGLKVYLTARFSSPIELGRLETADPLDPAVKKWWKDKIDHIYELIPDFGGFTVKANSEGQPGPQNYDRNHADGANMLAEALKPHGGIVMWRAFVYDADNTDDRAKQANTEFEPVDGQFLDNVLVQVKNGPIDFQPREPFHPLFGRMPKTPLIMEFQITQEYLGYATHLVYLPTMWKETLDADTHANGPGSTVGKILDGSITGHKLTGISGVTNIGDDVNWTGHPFTQSNWYGFGRLAWDHTLTAEDIADEWLRRTYDADEDFVNDMKEVMMASREAAVKYMTPLGLHHIMGWGHHHGPAPWIANKQRADWTSVYYHKADSLGIGFNRTSTGSDALSQYHPGAAKVWEDMDDCPEEFLLWFHHVPWDFKLNNGKSLWDNMCLTYQEGVDDVKGFVDVWKRQEGKVNKIRYSYVSQLLDQQYIEAKWWRDACLLYFQQFSKMDYPAGVPSAPETLEHYENIQFRYTPNRR